MTAEENRAGGPERERPGTRDGARESPRRSAASTPEEDDGELAVSPFPHPPWTVGLVLVAGVITLLFGILVNPIWLMVGSPFVVALALWLYVRLVVGPDALD